MSSNLPSPRGMISAMVACRLIYGILWVPQETFLKVYLLENWPSSEFLQNRKDLSSSHCWKVKFTTEACANSLSWLQVRKSFWVERPKSVNFGSKPALVQMCRLSVVCRLIWWERAASGREKNCILFWDDR